MTRKPYKDELEDLETKYTKALEIIKRLESRVSTLERENAYLRHQLEVLRKDAEEYKTKYEKLRGIIVRAFEISSGQAKPMSYKEMRRILYNEIGPKLDENI